MAAHWLQYVDSLLEGLTLLLHSFSFCSLPSSYPFICPSLCSAAASEASHTLIHHLSSAVSVRAGGKKREPELIRGRKPIQRPKKKHFLNLDFFFFLLYDFMNFLSQPWELKRGTVACTLRQYRKTKPDVFMVQRKTWNKSINSASRSLIGDLMGDFVLSSQAQRSYTWILIFKRH